MCEGGVRVGEPDGVNVTTVVEPLLSECRAGPTWEQGGLTLLGSFVSAEEKQQLVQAGTSPTWEQAGLTLVLVCTLLFNSASRARPTWEQDGLTLIIAQRKKNHN